MKVQGCCIICFSYVYLIYFSLPIALRVPKELYTDNRIIAPCQWNKIMPIGSCDKSYRGLFSSRKQTCDPWKVIQEAINMSQIADNGPGMMILNLWYSHIVSASHCQWYIQFELWLIYIRCSLSFVWEAPLKQDCWQLNYETHQSKWQYQWAAAPSGRSDRASWAREQKTAK